VKKTEVERGGESFIASSTPCQRKLWILGSQRSGKRDKLSYYFGLERGIEDLEAGSREDNTESAGSVG